MLSIVHDCGIASRYPGNVFFQCRIDAVYLKLVQWLLEKKTFYFCLVLLQ